MKAIVTAPGGLDALKLVDLPDPGKPGRGEIRVALHGCSINFQLAKEMAKVARTNIADCQMCSG